MLEGGIRAIFQRDILISNGISYQDGLDEVVTILVQGNRCGREVRMMQKKHLLEWRVEI